MRLSRRWSRLRADARRRLQRRRLLAHLPRGAACAEIGTWRGDFAVTILRSRRPRRLYLVDPWEHRSEEPYRGAMFGGLTRDGQREMDAIYEGVVADFRRRIDRGQVVVKRQRSVRAAEDFLDGSLDWVYIDADHTYEGVKRDLEAYFRAVRAGGYLAGDDYGQPGWWEDGVTRAVDEFATRCGGLKIIGSQFLLQKP
jgi:predicted O-methyltransferase YrrM